MSSRVVRRVVRRWWLARGDRRANEGVRAREARTRGNANVRRARTRDGTRRVARARTDAHANTYGITHGSPRTRGKRRAGAVGDGGTSTTERGVGPAQVDVQTPRPAGPQNRGRSRGRGRHGARSLHDGSDRSGRRGPDAAAPRRARARAAWCGWTVSVRYERTCRVAGLVKTSPWASPGARAAHPGPEGAHAPHLRRFRHWYVPQVLSNVRPVDKLRT